MLLVGVFIGIAVIIQNDHKQTLITDMKATQTYIYTKTGIWHIYRCSWCLTKVSEVLYPTLWHSILRVEQVDPAYPCLQKHTGLIGSWPSQKPPFAHCSRWQPVISAREWKHEMLKKSMRAWNSNTGCKNTNMGCDNSNTECYIFYMVS